MAMPGRIEPPRKAPSRDTRSTVIAVPTSTTTAGRSAGRSTLAATASSNRSTPTMSGRGNSTASGKSPAASRATRSCGRLPRNQSIKRAAAGRFTLRDAPRKAPRRRPAEFSPATRSRRQSPARGRPARSVARGVGNPAASRRSNQPILIRALPTSTAIIAAPAHQVSAGLFRAAAMAPVNWFSPCPVTAEISSTSRPRASATFRRTASARGGRPW